jgi:hypothetical protein
MSNELYLKDWINIAILIATTIAIIAGPIVAVHLTRLVDENKERRARQFSVFHELMRTRKVKLSLEHVSALNVVQIEFYGCEKIVTAYQAYIQQLNSPLPREPEALDHRFKEWDDTFFTMLNEMGLHLGYRLDKRDLERFSYAPQGWGNDEAQLRLFRQLVIEMLRGERAMPVTNFTGGSNKFPPPPEIEV